MSCTMFEYQDIIDDRYGRGLISRDKYIMMMGKLTLWQITFEALDEDDHHEYYDVEEDWGDEF